MKSIVLLMCLISPISWSQDYFMVLKKEDGSTETFNLKFIDKITFSGTTEINEIIKAKINFSLSQNYPNPFNPITNIEYELPERGMVKINVYNILGQEVKTLFEGRQNPGKQNIIWDGKNNNGREVSSGMYVYRIEFQSKVLAKKMLLIK